MQTEKAKAPVMSYAAALKTGLAVPEVSNENNRPKSPVECSSTASSKSDADISHATQGAAGSLSSEPSKSGNSTDSSDQVSQFQFHAFLSFFFISPSSSYSSCFASRITITLDAVSAVRKVLSC